jgi:hypothetical protein
MCRRLDSVCLQVELTYLVQIIRAETGASSIDRTRLSGSI